MRDETAVGGKFAKKCGSGERPWRGLPDCVEGSAEGRDHECMAPVHVVG